VQTQKGLATVLSKNGGVPGVHVLDGLHHVAGDWGTGHDPATVGPNGRQA
jgi:hypothetical protein